MTGGRRGNHHRRDGSLCCAETVAVPHLPNYGRCAPRAAGWRSYAMGKRWRGDFARVRQHNAIPLGAIARRGPGSYPICSTRPRPVRSPGRSDAGWDGHPDLVVTARCAGVWSSPRRRLWQGLHCQTRPFLYNGRCKSRARRAAHDRAGHPGDLHRLRLTLVLPQHRAN